MRRRVMVCVGVVAASVFGGCVSVAAPTVVRAAPAVTTTASSGTFVKVAPLRVLDTRSGVGAAKAAVAADGSVSLLLSGVGGVPSGAPAVMLTVMVTAPAAAGSVTVFKTGAARPATTDVDFAKAQTVSNTVVVQVGTGGKVTFFNNSAGTVQLVADLAGYYIAGTPSVPGAYSPVTPSRLVDTRTGVGAPAHAVAAHATITVQVAGKGGIPTVAGGTAVVLLDLGVLASTASGLLVAYQAGSTRPDTTTVAFAVGKSAVNQAAVRVSSAGQISLYNNSTGTVQITGDAIGYYLTGTPTATGTFDKLAPARLFDTRTGIDAPAAAVAAHGTVTIQATGKAGLPLTGVTAVLINVNAYTPSAAGFLTVYPTGSAVPPTQNTNFTAGASSANLVLSRVSSTGQISVYNASAGTVQIAADIVGYVVHDFTWGTASIVDPSAGRPKAISCPSGTTFCAVADASGAVLTLTGTTWSAPRTVDAAGGGLTAISCPSATFCATVDTAGKAITLNGTTWSAPVSIDPSGGGLTSVSCASSKFCVAVDAHGGAVTYSGATWGTPVSVDPNGGGLTSISCPTSAFCIAVGARGNATTYASGKWGPPASVDPKGGGFTSISCPTSTFCVALDTAGDATTFTGATWGTPVSLDTGGPLPISCPTTVFCATMDESGDGFTFNGASWTEIGPIDAPNRDWLSAYISVSCSASSRCVAVDDLNGNAETFNSAGVVASLVNVDPRNGTPYAVSCPTSTFCAVAGGFYNANTLTFNGNAWNRPFNNSNTNFYMYSSLVSVSCPSASFCAATDESGGATTFNGTTWTPVVGVAPSGGDGTQLGWLTSVSCPSAMFCMAVDLYGNYLTYNGSGWTQLTPFDSNDNSESVSCATSTFCVATDGSGAAMTYNGTTWSAPVTIDSGYTLSSVSCPTTTFCAAVDDTAHAFMFNGSSWSAGALIGSPGSDESVSCVSAAFCEALTGNTAVRYNGTSWGQASPVTGTSISCASSSFCVAADSNGSVTIGTR